MSLWTINDFDYTARYLAAKSFEWIQMFANAPYEGTIFEQLKQATESTHLAQTKRKMFSLHEALAIYPEWQNDRTLLEITKTRPISISDVRMFAHNLKTAELEMQMFFLAANAVLHAKQLVANGKAWPTIEDLEGSGFDMKDPIHGEKYAWRDFQGHKRLFGLPYARLEKQEPNFLLLSFHEQYGGQEPPSL
jgi:hypothetical protein